MRAPGAGMLPLLTAGARGRAGLLLRPPLSAACRAGRASAVLRPAVHPPTAAVTKGLAACLHAGRRPRIVLVARRCGAGVRRSSGMANQLAPKPASPTGRGWGGGGRASGFGNLWAPMKVVAMVIGPIYVASFLLGSFLLGSYSEEIKAFEAEIAQFVRSGPKPQANHGEAPGAGPSSLELQALKLGQPSDDMASGDMPGSVLNAETSWDGAYTERGMRFASRYALELRDDGTIRGWGTDSDGDFQVMFGRFDKTSGRMGWLEQGSVYTVCTGTCVWRDGNAGRFVSPERAGSGPHFP